MQILVISMISLYDIIIHAQTFALVNVFHFSIFSEQFVSIKLKWVNIWTVYDKNGLGKKFWKRCISCIIDRNKSKPNLKRIIPVVLEMLKNHFPINFNVAFALTGCHGNDKGGIFLISLLKMDKLCMGIFFRFCKLVWDKKCRPKMQIP